MFDDVGQFLSVALAVFSIASIAGLGVVSGSQKRLRQDNEDLRNRDADREKEMARADARHAAEVAELRAANVELTSDLAALGRAVRGEAFWAEVVNRLEETERRVDAHHAEAVAHWQADEALLADVRDLLANWPTDDGKKPT